MSCPLITPARTGRLIANEPCSRFGPGTSPTGPGPIFSYGLGPASSGPDSSNNGPEEYPVGPELFENGPDASQFVLEPSTASPDPSFSGPGPFGPWPAHFAPTTSRSGPGSFGPGPVEFAPNVCPFSPRPVAFAPNVCPFGPGPSGPGLLTCTTSPVDPALLAPDASFGPGPFGTGPALPLDLSPFGPGRASSFTSGISSNLGPRPSPRSTFNRGPVSCFGPSAGPILINYTTVTKGEQKRFFCAPCGRGFDRALQLERHITTTLHANTLVAEGITFDPADSQTVSCPFCDHAFNRPDNLRPHLLRHMGYGNPTKTRTRQVSVEDSIRVGLGHIDPRCVDFVPGSV